MDFRLSDASEQLRREVRAFLEDYLSPEREAALHESGTSYDVELYRELAERGWLNPELPQEMGGLGRDPLEMLPLREELQHIDAPIYAAAIDAMIVKVIHRLGSDRLKDEVLPSVMAGKRSIALGFSEPEAGSDVAAVATRARRDGDDWVIDGQKMFTTNAHAVHYVFLLTRTNPDAPNHRALTTFLVPLDAEGVEIQGVQTISGERTNITFYNEVRVDDAWRIGEVDKGWGSLMLALQDEHSGGYGGHLERLLDHAESWARRATDDGGSAPLDDPDVRARLARIATELEVTMLLQRRAAWMDHVGRTPETEGPMAKLFSTESLVRASEDVMAMVGPDGLRSYLEPTAPERGHFEHLLLFAPGTTTYAGTSEVQRNIIGQRGLGLPR